MKSNTPSKVIAITGASSGLGAALARDYAAPNVSLVLASRNMEALKQVASDCEKRGANVTYTQVDICHHDQIATWISDIEKKQAITLLIANAGVFSGHGKDQEIETPHALAKQIETNLTGTLATAALIAPIMKHRNHGHIALVSSLAAVQPLADAPSYSASKAGIIAYGEALRDYFRADNITVSVICPGHIKTAQTAIHAGDLTGIISAKKAAGIIHRALDRGRTFIAFPRPIYFLVLLGRFLPWRLRSYINRPFRFYVKSLPPKDN